MTSTRRMHVLSACAIGLFAASSALAGGTEAAPAQSANTLSDMKVARDRETGALRAPSADENAALGARAFSLPSSVVVQRRPFTTVEVRADGSAVAKRSLDDMDNLVLTRTPDGKPVFSHSERPAPTAPTKSLPKE